MFWSALFDMGFVQGVCAGGVFELPPLRYIQKRDQNQKKTKGKVTLYFLSIFLHEVRSLRQGLFTNTRRL
jgi:hypothetical protein